MRRTVEYCRTRCAVLLRQAGARIDRRTRWTLVPLLVIVIISVPIWSAAVRLTSLATPPSDSLRVPILVYHSVAPTHPGQSAEQRLLDVDPVIFRRQMSYLAANGYAVIPLGALVDALQGHGGVPARAVVLTFDDGWLTQYQNALPILEQMHYTATFFVITAQVGRGTMYMGLDELRTLQRAGMTIAAHTRTHLDLTKVSDAQLRDEVLGSRQDLQTMLGVAADLFAYPYGAWNRRVVAAVQNAGYRAARALPGGAWNNATDRFALHAVLATDDMDAFVREVGVPVIAARRSTTATAGTATATATDMNTEDAEEQRGRRGVPDCRSGGPSRFGDSRSGWSLETVGEVRIRTDQRIDSVYDHDSVRRGRKCFDGAGERG